LGLFRKNESYATETGEIVRRQTKMHKWGIPLAWVIGVGVSAPAGGVAGMWAGTCAAWHEYGQGDGVVVIGSRLLNTQRSNLDFAYLSFGSY
jgi:hypothetical protein